MLPLSHETFTSQTGGITTTTHAPKSRLWPLRPRGVLEERVASCRRNPYFSPCSFLSAGAVVQTCRFLNLRARRRKPLVLSLFNFVRRRGTREGSVSYLSRLCAKSTRPTMRGWASEVVRARSLSENRIFGTPLFLPMSFFVGLRGGLAMLFSDPLALSFKTPRFCDVKFCALARVFRGLCVRSLTLTVGK